MKLSKLLVDLQNALKQPALLGVDIILGYPNLGRTTPIYPMGSLMFVEDGYAVRPSQGGTLPRLGQHQPVGTTVRALLMLFASNEYSLLELVDKLRAVRESVAVVASEGVDYKVRFDTLRRADGSSPLPEEEMLMYAIQCEVSITTYI